MWPFWPWLCLVIPAKQAYGLPTPADHVHRPNHLSFANYLDRRFVVLSLTGTDHPNHLLRLAKDPADVLVDAMRGRFHTWTRIRVNLQHVPEPLRPAQEPLDPDEDMASDWDGVIQGEAGPPRRPSRARKRS